MKNNNYKKIIAFTVLCVAFSSRVFAKGEYETKNIILENIISVVWTIPIELTIKDFSPDVKQDVAKAGLLKVYAPESVIKTLSPIKKDTAGAYKIVFLNGLQTLKVNKRSQATLFVPKEQLAQIALEGIGKINMETQFSKDSVDIVLNGIGSIKVNSVNKTKKLQISNKGTGKISVFDINDVENVTLVNKGIGNVLLVKTNAIKNLTLTQNGTGKTEGVSADNLTINFDSASALYVEAREKLIIEQLDGIGKIFYRGGASPQIIPTDKNVKKVKPW